MVINTPFPGLRIAKSLITPAGQGDDSYFRLPVGRNVIYLSLLTVRAAVRAAASPPVHFHRWLHDGCRTSLFHFRTLAA